MSFLPFRGTSPRSIGSCLFSNMMARSPSPWLILPISIRSIAWVFFCNASWNWCAPVPRKFARHWSNITGQPTKQRTSCRKESAKTSISDWKLAMARKRLPLMKRMRRLSGWSRCCWSRRIARARATFISNHWTKNFGSGFGSTAFCRKCKRRRNACNQPLSAASKSWPVQWALPRNACPRTVGSR